MGIWEYNFFITDTGMRSSDGSNFGNLMMLIF